MAAGLRRMIALGPAGSIWPGSSQDLRVGANRAMVRETRTRWVRLWADWPSLEPARGQLDQGRLQALDAQIAAAKADGLKVILTPYRFPTWANGTATMTAAQLAATMPDRRFPSDPESKAKSLLFRYPSDVSETSDLGRFLDLLLRRWAGRLDVLEVCNEPNHQWWPQQAPSADPANAYAQGSIVVAEVVAKMFVTAQRLASRVTNAPMLAGPGCADGVDANRMRTGYHSMAERLLTRLPQLGFRGSARFVYTHHNYSDVAADNGTRTADLRRRLVGRWAGWPSADAANPQVWITEGGVTLSKIGSAYAVADPAVRRTKQAELVKRNFDRMAAATGDGAGISATCQYLLHTDPNYDSGLCETAETGGAKRPVYWTWQALPSAQ